MSNEANLELQFLNLKDSEDVILKKFFLVHFLEPRSKGNNLRSYLCLIWRYNNLHLNNKPTILLRLNGNFTSRMKDVRHFFGENIVLQQFWSSFRGLGSLKDFVNSFKYRDCSNPNLASSIIYKCLRDERLDNNLIFYTAKEQENYDHIIFPIKNVVDFYDHNKKELLIFPEDLGLDQILSDAALCDLNPTFLPCFALWISWTEDLEFQSFRSFHYDITYDIELSHNLQEVEREKYIKISEFHTYFFLPHAYDLDSQACNYPSVTRYSNEDFELERSYSQKRLEYFDEWEKFGIKSQAAFRTHSSKKFVDYFRNRFSYLQFSFTVVDRDSRLHAGLNLTIATIIMAILWEIGHDKIHDLTTFRKLRYITDDALWLIMNSLMFFGAIRVFFYQDWFARGSTFKEIVISIGIIFYSIYYALFMILNIFLKKPIGITWLSKLSEIIFNEYILIPVVLTSLTLYLVNKFILRKLYKRFKKILFK